MIEWAYDVLIFRTLISKNLDLIFNKIRSNIQELCEEDVSNYFMRAFINKYKYPLKIF